ncbi:MAG: Crp/Fnr family transcriptional regulator [Acetivibrionales bacterium]|jgi:CRP/FNR family cyclic AMP-dependent transcriptional regulator
MKNADVIQKASFFSGLSEKDLEKIADISIERNYKKNMIIFIEGEPGEAFYYIKAGKVKVFRSYEDGREHIIHILSEGDVFGEATLFSGIPYPASASVHEDAILGMIKNSDLESLVRENPDLSLSLIRLLSRKLVFAQEKVRDLTFNDVFSRTASQILKLAHYNGKTTEKGVAIDIRFSRQELAEMVGTTRESVSRVISKFKKEKSIAEENDMLIILNERKLKSWI